MLYNKRCESAKLPVMSVYVDFSACMKIRVTLLFYHNECKGPFHVERVTSPGTQLRILSEIQSSLQKGERSRGCKNVLAQSAISLQI